MNDADALFIGAHPDDIELTCGGLAARLALEGRAVLMCDLTRGEAASRGTATQRAAEATEAARILGVAGRENLSLPDGGLNRHDPGQMAAVVALLRRARPSLVVAPDARDPHPDHTEGSRLLTRAAYLAGIKNFPAPGEPFRPDLVLHAVFRHTLAPDLVVDISDVFERRMSAVRAHKSQLGLDASSGHGTYLTAEGFLEEVTARARVLGGRIGVRYGEGFRVAGPVPLWNVLALLRRERGAERRSA